MNYYQALEIKGKDGKGTGKYHFTRTNDGITFPVGYCAECLFASNKLTPPRKENNYEFLL